MTAIFQQCVDMCGPHHLTSSVKPEEEEEEGEVGREEEEDEKEEATKSRMCL